MLLFNAFEGMPCGMIIPSIFGWNAKIVCKAKSVKETAKECIWVKFPDRETGFDATREFCGKQSQAPSKPWRRSRRRAASRQLNLAFRTKLSQKYFSKSEWKNFVED